MEVFLKKLAAVILLLSLAAVAQNPVPPQPEPDAVTIGIQLLEPPQPAGQPTIQQIGGGGPTGVTYYYFVVAHFLVGAAAPSPAVQANNAPVTLSGGHYFTIFWQAVAGATGYDVLRTTSPQPPAGACACAVVTNTGSLSANDQSNSLSAYTVATFDPNSLHLFLDNEAQSAAVSHLILRQGPAGTFVADLSSGGGGGGSVTSVGVTVNGAGSSGALAIGGSPVTTSGTINLAWTGTNGDLLKFGAGNAVTDSGVLLSSLCNGVNSGCVVTAPAADQTITGEHSLILSGAGGTISLAPSAVSAEVSTGDIILSTDTARILIDAQTLLSLTSESTAITLNPATVVSIGGGETPFGGFGDSGLLFAGPPESSLPAFIQGFFGGRLTAEFTSTADTGPAIGILSSTPGALYAVGYFDGGNTVVFQGFGTGAGGMLTTLIGIGADGAGATGPLAGLVIQNIGLNDGATSPGVIGLEIQDLTALHANPVALQIDGTQQVELGNGLTTAGVLTTIPIAVGSLPAAAVGNAGYFQIVNDSTAVALEGQMCVGGDSHTALALSDGTQWKCF